MRHLRELWDHPNFRWLWLGQSISAAGDRIVFVALALFVIGQGDSATDLGLVLGAHVLPLVAFLLVGGVWADRLPRQQIMIATDLVRFGVHALLAVLIVAGRVPIWQIVAIEATFGTAEAFFRPAYTGLLPQTVPDELIQPARALTSLTENVAEFAGPAIATALVVGLGPATAFALDAASFLVSAALLLRVRARRRGVAAPAAAAGSFVGDLRHGWREVRSRAWVWATVLAFSLSLLLAFAPYSVLGPVVARERYGSTSIYGVVAAAFGAGTMLGSLVGVRWRPVRPMLIGCLYTMLWPASLGLFALGVPLALVLPASVAAGAGLGLFMVWWETALAERIPPAALSRVSSYDWMGSLALMPLGYVLAGPAADAFGAVNVLVAGSALALLAQLLALAPRETRALRRLEPGEAPAYVGVT